LDPNPYTDADIVIVDDEVGVARFLGRVLCWAGYKPPRIFSNPLEAAEYLRSADADLVTLDIRMPGLDGYDLLALLAQKSGPAVPSAVLAISAVDTYEERNKAIKAGAKDFLIKPVEPQELLLHVYALLDARFKERGQKQSRGALAEKAKDRAARARSAQLETVDRLAKVAEIRDDATGQHTYRVARLSALLAMEMRLSPEEAELIMRAAPLHDVGKTGIEDKVLLKKGPLSVDERKLMQQHAMLGGDILGGATCDILRMAEVISTCHHERWDGEGYPRGLSGADIPLAARIVAVADAFDALTHERPHRDAWPVGRALGEIELGRGTQFDPEVVDALNRFVYTVPDLIDAPSGRTSLVR
jgi:putative two-component system response regulator